MITGIIGILGLTAYKSGFYFSRFAHARAKAYEHQLLLQGLMQIGIEMADKHSQTLQESQNSREIEVGLSAYKGRIRIIPGREFVGITAQLELGSKIVRSISCQMAWSPEQKLTIWGFQKEMIPLY